MKITLLCVCVLVWFVLGFFCEILFTFFCAWKLECCICLALWDCRLCLCSASSGTGPLLAVAEKPVGYKLKKQILLSALGLVRHKEPA